MSGKAFGYLNRCARRSSGRAGDLPRTKPEELIGLVEKADAEESGTVEQKRTPAGGLMTTDHGVSAAT